MSNIDLQLIAERKAAAFLHSAGVLTYAERRHIHRVHAACLLIFIILLAVFFALTLGPGFVAWVHQAIVAGHTAIQLLKWSPQ